MVVEEVIVDGWTVAPDGWWGSLVVRWRWVVLSPSIRGGVGAGAGC